MLTKPIPEKQPVTVEDIIEKIMKKTATGKYLFRGENNKDYSKVSSKLYREYHDIESFNIQIIEAEMLWDATKHIVHPSDSFHTRKISNSKVNWGILTEIQHYGGKTNLIDFTSDYLIALFFACDGLPNKDGRIILQDTEKINDDWVIQPQTPIHRIMIQKSVFIKPPTGFIEPKNEDIVVIPAFLKHQLLDYLRKNHHISTETIYNDIYGYIENQNIHCDAYRQVYRGKAYTHKESYEEAIECYTEAIKLKPNYTMAYYDRGNAYNRIGEYNLAIEDYTKAIELMPNFPGAYAQRGHIHEEINKHDIAVEDYTKAIELMSDDADMHKIWGDVSQRIGYHIFAIMRYTKAIELKPNDAEAYCRRGVAYYKASEYNLAIKDYTKAIELKPDYAEAYCDRGMAYNEIGKYNLALEDYTKAIELKPDYAIAYNNRGTNHVENGEYDLGIEDLSKAIELKPDFPIAHSNLKTAYEKKNQ